MDNNPLYLSYLLEFCMLIPAAEIAITPVRNYERISDEKMNAAVAVTLALLIIGGSYVCMKLNLPTNVVLIPVALVLFVPYARLLDLSLSKKIFCFANAGLLCAFATLYAILISASWEASNTSEVLYPQSGALALAIAEGLYLAFGRTLIIKLPALLDHEAISDLWKWLALIPFLLSLVVWWMVPRNLALVMLGRSQAIMLLLTAFIPIVGWLVYHFAWRVMSRVSEEAQLREEVTLLRAEEKRFEEFRTYTAQARAMRHDFRHHLLAMKGMLEANKTSELAEYIDQLTDMEAEGQRPQLCRNAAVDAVAAHYDALAREKGVSVSWYLDLPEELPIAEADMCAILGNLVENAITATSKLDRDERWVEVTSQKVTENALGLTVRNSYAGEVKLGRNGLPKGTRRGHGIGLSSVVTTVQQYNGGYDIRTDNNEFFFGVVLYHD